MVREFDYICPLVNSSGQKVSVVGTNVTLDMLNGHLPIGQPVCAPTINAHLIIRKLHNATKLLAIPI